MRIQKKYIIRALILLPILLLAVYLYYIFPRELDKEYQGIYYKLGDTDFSEKITVSFDGTLRKRVWKADYFEGTMKVGALEMFVQLYLPKDGFTDIIYRDYKHFERYGSLYTKDIRKDFTICIYLKDEANRNYLSWSGQDGYMISAPADNREEALELSRRLVEPMLMEESR